MAVTINDVAKKAGVNKTTVSLVLNGKSSSARIALGTQKRILEVAKDLDYRPSFSARALAMGRTFSLGMVCGDIHSPHFAELCTLFMHEATKRGYQLLLSATEWNYERELECLESLMDRGVDGILMHSAALTTDTVQYKRIVKQNFPIVMFDARVEHLNTVYVDWSLGVKEAVEYLSTKGCRNALYIRQVGSPIEYDLKYCSAVGTCEDCGIEISTVECKVEVDRAREVATELADSGNLPDAIIALSDYMAMGVIRGLRDKGVSVPDDVMVVGMDGTNYGQLYCPSISSVAQDRRGIVDNSLNLLEKMIDGDSGEPEHIGVPTHFVPAESA